MVILNFIFSENQYEIKIILAAFLFIIMFFALGRIVQEYFSIKRKYYMMSFPIGFMIYIGITQILYSVLIMNILSIPNNILVIMEVIKNTFLWIIIIFFYKLWIPKISISNKSTWNFISIAVIIFICILTFYILEENVFNVENSIKKNGLSSSIKNSFFISLFTIPKNLGILDFWTINVESIDSEILINITNEYIYSVAQYQTFYYWISSIASIISNSQDQYIDSVIYISKYITPLFFLLAIIFSVHHMVCKSQDIWISQIISFVISLLLIILFSFIGSFRNEFYSMFMLIIIFIILISYSMDNISDNRYISLILWTSILTISVTIWSIFIIIVIGAISTLLIIIKSGDFIENFIVLVTMLFVVQILFIIITFFEFVDLFHSLIYWLLFLSILGPAIVMPLYSLEHMSNRRLDLNSFQQKSTKKIHYYVWFFSMIITVFIVIINILLKNDIFLLISFYFNNLYKYNIYISILIYVLFIPFTILLIYIAKFFGYENSFLTLFVFVNVIFNPITLSQFFVIFDMNINWIVLMTPSILLLISWLTTTILESLPKTIRL